MRPRPAPGPRGRAGGRRPPLRARRAAGNTTIRDLERRRDALRAHLLERPDDGEAHLEVGVLEKLLGGEAGIVPAFHHLRRALALLPPQALAARQRALFVLGLTYGDVARPHDAVARFDEAAAADSGSTAAVAARSYAAAYRERFPATT